MDKFDENGLGLIGSMNLQGGEEEEVRSCRGLIQDRREEHLVLLTRTSIIEAPSYPYAVNKRSVSENGVSNKPPLHRPFTRKFAAQLAANNPQIKEEETKKSDSVSREEPERIVIDMDDTDKECDFSEPMYVQHSEAMMEEMDQMDEEIEMEDVDNEEVAVINIDACGEKNSLAVVEYIDDIHIFYKKSEGLPHQDCVFKLGHHF